VSRLVKARVAEEVEVRVSDLVAPQLAVVAVVVVARVTDVALSGGARGCHCWCR
jgi:hypothetical protein